MSDTTPPLIERLRDLPEKIEHVHLVAVGGVGMGALAGMLKQHGFRVTGSDEQLYPPMSVILERLGIEAKQGYSPDNLNDNPHLVVIGNKVSRSNPEAAAVIERGLPYLSFPEALSRFFISGRRSLVVAGTHGKTTSTAMLAWVLEATGRDPSFMVGGESLNFGGNFKLGAGEFFVVEGDEYDSAFFDKGPKFLHYQPSAVLLTAVEFDHADIYRDLDHVKEAFRRLLPLLPADGPLVVASDYPHAIDCARSARGAFTTFGFHADASWRASDLSDTGRVSRFKILHAGRLEGTVDLPQPGAINALNALGVYVLCREIGLAHKEIAAALAQFAGVRRRQEMVGELSGVVVIDDFAHHPTAVAGTLRALRLRYPDRRLWALFEPRSNTSRRKVFQDDYRRALSQADRIIVASVFVKATDRVEASELFSPEQLVNELLADGRVAYTADSTEAIVQIVSAEVAPGDVIVMMSNGDFGGLRERLLLALQGDRDDDTRAGARPRR